MAATRRPGVTVLDRRLRLSLLDRTGSDERFRQLVDQALGAAEAAGGDLPLVLYLSLVRAGLSGSGAGGRGGAAPFTPEGSPAPGDEQEGCLREIRVRWQAHTRRHLFTDPAVRLGALLPSAPLAGNPYSLARLLRVFVGHLAGTDCGRAAALAALIEDPGEAAVAQCALVGAGLAAHDLEREAQAWSRQRHLLTRMPSWSWPGGRDGHDREVLAYLRPDHRARFDTAVGVLPFATGLGHALLAGLPALGEVHRAAFVCHGSAVYAEQRLAGRRPDPEAAAAHDEVRRNPAAAGPVVAAVVSANEQVLGAAELPVGDPVYRLYARITARTTRAHRLGADSLAPEPVPDGFDVRRLPAYAEIVRQNADTPIVAALAARVRAEATAGGDREALLILADAGYADPDPLLDATDAPTGRHPLLDATDPPPGRHPLPDATDAPTGPHPLLGGTGPLPGSPGPVPIEPGPARRRGRAGRSRDVTVERCPELAVLLFRHRPAEAVRRVGAAARADWTVAAAMLEHAAAELLALAGPRIAADLHDAVVRAATCTAPPGVTPPVVDGAHPAGGASDG
ncbi:hypothetical protein [Actinoplanes subglobosus]|uniref:Uncharacterized protein n=1 Tax=Actinoplanes subglobosus TaxID=1547892 RepID=A0ABV8J449_9ACTN